MKRGDEQAAEEFFREALALDPEFTEAAITLNKLLLHQENYEGVLEITSDFDRGGGADPQFHWDAAMSFQQN